MSSLENKEKELIIKFVGVDDWDRPVYIDEKGKLYKDTNLGKGKMALCTAYNNEFYSEPEIPLRENIIIKVVEEFDNRDVNKYILDECAKFNLTEKITNQEINKYYKQITSLDDDNLSIKDKKIYLYDYLVNDMIKNEEITQQEGKDFMKQIEKQVKSKSKERSR